MTETTSASTTNSTPTAKLASLRDSPLASVAGWQPPVIEIASDKPLVPPPNLIRQIIRCGLRMGRELTWQQAREIAMEVVGNTANDNWS